MARQYGWMGGTLNGLMIGACPDCGSVVFDAMKHDAWHLELELRASREPVRR